jgi:hypothetical protein
MITNPLGDSTQECKLSSKPRCIRRKQTKCTAIFSPKTPGIMLRTCSISKASITSFHIPHLPTPPSTTISSLGPRQTSFHILRNPLLHHPPRLLLLLLPQPLLLSHIHIVSCPASAAPIQRFALRRLSGRKRCGRGRLYLRQPRRRELGWGDVVPCAAAPSMLVLGEG